jgi:hypothetical protein
LWSLLEFFFNFFNKETKIDKKMTDDAKNNEEVERPVDSDRHIQQIIGKFSSANVEQVSFLSRHYRVRQLTYDTQA